MGTMKTLLGMALGLLLVGCGDDDTGGGGSGQGGSGTGATGTGASGTGASSTGGSGTGGAGSCTAGTFCTDRCVDTDLNPLHCGDCGNPCGADEVCVGGSCEIATCDGAGGDACGGDGCCNGVCCPDGTTCFSDIPSFYGCCPEGDNCGCIGIDCPDG